MYSWNVRDNPFLTSHSIISLCTIIKEKKKPNSVDQYTFIFYSEKKNCSNKKRISCFQTDKHTTRLEEKMEAMGRGW